MAPRVSPTETIRAEIHDLFAGGGDLMGAIEQVARLSVRLTFQSVIEEIVLQELGREAGQRLGPARSRGAGLPFRPSGAGRRRPQQAGTRRRPGGRFRAGKPPLALNQAKSRPFRRNSEVCRGIWGLAAWGAGGFRVKAGRRPPTPLAASPVALTPRGERVDCELASVLWSAVRRRRSAALASRVRVRENALLAWED